MVVVIPGFFFNCEVRDAHVEEVYKIEIIKGGVWFAK